MPDETPIDLGGGDILEPLPSPLVPEETLTVYAWAYCTYEGGIKAGPFTISADIKVTDTAQYLAEQLQARADSVCLQGTMGLLPGGAIKATYVIVSPTFFQYPSGI